MLNDIKILMKSLSDIDIRIMLCKSAFEWELLAKKYNALRDEIEAFCASGLPEDVEKALDKTRAYLVEKKGELPPLDLSDFFK